MTAGRAMSRVRPLTENARTPATPTTAIASATAAKMLKTSVFNRSGVSTSARTSSSVAARSIGCSADICRMMRVMGGTSAYRSALWLINTVALGTHDDDAEIGAMLACGATQSAN